jgi:hypothetical protein
MEQSWDKHKERVELFTNEVLSERGEFCCAVMSVHHVIEAAWRYRVWLHCSTHKRRLFIVDLTRMPNLNPSSDDALKAHIRELIASAKSDYDEQAAVG